MVRRLAGGLLVAAAVALAGCPGMNFCGVLTRPERHASWSVALPWQTTGGVSATDALYPMTERRDRLTFPLAGGKYAAGLFRFARATGSVVLQAVPATTADASQSAWFAVASGSFESLANIPGDAFPIDATPDVDLPVQPGGVYFYHVLFKRGGYYGKVRVAGIASDAISIDLVAEEVAGQNALSLESGLKPAQPDDSWLAPDPLATPSPVPSPTPAATPSPTP